MRIIGIDPGYIKLGIGIIEVENDGKIFVTDSVILYPTWQGDAKSLDKIEAMLDAIEKLQFKEPDLFAGDLAIIEGQESYARFKGFKGVNANVLIRMGKISGGFFTLLDCPEKHFVLPKTWTKRRCKEDNHCIILDKLENYNPSEWPWLGKTKRSDYEHAIDAVGLALWGYEEYLKEKK